MRIEYRDDHTWMPLLQEAIGRVEVVGELVQHGNGSGGSESFATIGGRVLTEENLFRGTGRRLETGRGLSEC